MFSHIKQKAQEDFENFMKTLRAHQETAKWERQMKALGKLSAEEERQARQEAGDYELR